MQAMCYVPGVTLHPQDDSVVARVRALSCFQVIVGVHDSRSIYLLKKRVPVDSTEKRMLNVKQYADVVIIIASTTLSAFSLGITDQS